MALQVPRIIADQAEEDPVLRAVRTAPVEPGAPPEHEAESLARARAGRWVSSALVSAEISARAPAK